MGLFCPRLEITGARAKPLLLFALGWGDCSVPAASFGCRTRGQLAPARAGPERAALIPLRSTAQEVFGVLRRYSGCSGGIWGALEVFGVLWRYLGCSPCSDFALTPLRSPHQDGDGVGAAVTLCFTLALNLDNCPKFSPAAVWLLLDAPGPPCPAPAARPHPRSTSPCACRCPVGAVPPPLQPPRWPHRRAWRCGCRSPSPSASGITGSSG